MTTWPHARRIGVAVAVLLSRQATSRPRPTPRNAGPLRPTTPGLAAARARGRVGGRPTVINADLLRSARDLLPNPDAGVASIARLLGVSPGTLYNHLPDLRALRAAGRVRAELTA